MSYPIQMHQGHERSRPDNKRTGLILGIESSCDETAAAVVRDGREVLSNVVASQMEMHALYGGVVPELASREHLRNIVPVVREALRHASVTAADLEAIAVTSGPGLAGALLVGISFAKAYAFGLGKPLLAVNHLEGHIHAVLMNVVATRPVLSSPKDLASETWDDESPDAAEPMSQKRDMGHPLLALVVSGGHTHLYLAQQNDGTWHYRNVGRTVDDAAGEAYDKVAKLLGLGYPGGPWIDRLSAFGNANAVPFRFTDINRGTSEDPSFDFSFSGIKTAVLRYVETHGLANGDRGPSCGIGAGRFANIRRGACPLRCGNTRPDRLISSAVVGNLMRQTLAAAVHFRISTIVVSGGVAANRSLRARFAEAAAQRGLSVHFPQAALSTDNAAMIAAAAWPKLLGGDVADATLNATPQLRLG